MRTFRFYFKVPESSISVYKPYSPRVGTLQVVIPRLQGGVVELQIHDVRRTVREAAVHSGLFVQADLPGNNLDKALEEANGRLQAHLSLSALQSDASVGQPLLVLGYETTPGAQTTEFIQIDRREGELAELSKRTRALDHDELRRLAEAFYASDDPHIARAIRWYRKGLSEDDPLDQFTNYWHGLEALNKPLQALLDGMIEVGTCRHCGAQFEVKSISGIRALFDKHAPEGVKDFRHCRDVRNELQHGGGSLAALSLHLPECTELCRSMLRLGIHLVLGYPLEEARSGTQPVYNVHPAYTEYRGIYQIAPDKLSEAPMLSVSSEIYDVGGTEDERKLSIRDNIDSNMDVDIHITATDVRESGADVGVPELRLVPRTREVNSYIGDEPMPADGDPKLSPPSNDGNS